ncbi:MAG: hypothetical protein GY797_13555 [Deltaproteobacteria bacterium]|nr:hypothetical protein [Deltaproteobacteria bacterium]
MTKKKQNKDKTNNMMVNVIYGMGFLMIVYIIIFFAWDNFFLRKKLNRLRRAICHFFSFAGLIFVMLSMGHFAKWADGAGGLSWRDWQILTTILLIIDMVYVLAFYFSSVLTEQVLGNLLPKMPDGPQKRGFEKMLNDIKILEGKGNKYDDKAQS